ncbi:hypothetical protein WR25_19986 [Diploscapter pachys]|uniref:Very-long-chain (3R)-3-hydroxyacyl-CoA dehydratase n=1 Tax=Diploscapter pachys TaxID=2018661 RepID=A0A2A2KVG2_9BILA|nr:hypothetical protein WR25_19986 [Diploscapter pachys]
MSNAKLYLFVYNAAQVLGWSIILIKTVFGLMEGLKWKDLYESVQLEVEIFQTAAILEVLHSVLGLVRSPLGTTLMQVSSRLALVWPILHVASSSRHSLGVPLLLLAWSITEVIRYSFYALSLFNSVPYFIIWLRYTTFIVLYPTGVTGELLTLFAGLPEIGREKYYTLEMPNPANMGISLWWLLFLASFTYIPGFPQLYFYMFSQRKKVLGTEPEKKKQ